MEDSASSIIPAVQDLLPISMAVIIVLYNSQIVWHTKMTWIPTLPSTGSRYVALADAIEHAIETGQLKVGDRLPPHREIAWRLGLDTSTVTKAYLEASRRHLIHGEVGRGTYVLGRSRAAEMFESHADDQTILDLSVNAPIAATDDAFAMAVERAIKTPDKDWRGYASQRLIRRLQIAGVRWLAMRGLSARPEEVVPVAGGQAGLAAILSVLDIKSLGIEEQTYSGVIALAHGRAIKAVDLEMDSHGVIPESLTDALIDAAILTPTLHNPTGKIWPETRRHDLLAVAARQGTLIIEDDAYGPLADIQPMAALSSEAPILFVSTLSKTVAAGLRTGFIWGRGQTIEKLSSAVYATSWGMAPLMMEVAIQWIESGIVDQQIADQRTEIEARHRLAAAFFPELRGNPPSPHVFLRTLAPAQLFELAGVRVAPSSAFSRRPQTNQGIRISLNAAPSRVALDIALSKCAGIIHAHARS
ncbi:PLP-dependent aminotransferase family protein (plasmid) [Agrobacterium tumefaciens]|uniref:aminotransferase-like domain-containing protein n=1 Tax=Agrobacterium tumefaciens TaxID=358 RepID=UPI001573EC51|nr:PLP-dependent aminotransferase family protein [Agrobacterium tumefaciens]NSZ66545.1 PLP-dependent aminotransferase family protein [Agrobacterium tumefaciens]NTA72917.1 PLP-dependent aminotransferase family protein [Agrobacterium tumefaciens]WIE41465.1 PLP-dependent aminotransferase family protein [Agrobacterium tumefaciens]